MTIKIAYRTEPHELGTHHIAEGVTPGGEPLRYTKLVYVREVEEYGPLVVQAAKRYVLHNLIDDAIHRGLL